MASLSMDGGRTWPYTRTVEDSPVPLDYPTVVESGGTSKIIYAYGHQQIRFVELKEDDLKCRWTCINDGSAWSVGDGALHYAGGSAPETGLDWLRWSKVVAFLPRLPEKFSIEADVRFDAPDPADGAIGVFFAYQDESNWSGWICTLKGKAGIEKEAHWGSLAQPAYSRNISLTYFENYLPQTGHWYKVRILAQPSKTQWYFMDKGSGAVLLSANNALDWQGSFLGLGVREVPASFANVLVKPTT